MSTETNTTQATVSETTTSQTQTSQKNTQAKKGFSVRALVQIGMLAAIAIVLMLFDIPLPFAPSFYKIDFSEVPVLIGCFAMGPAAGAAIEFVKILLNFAVNGTTTAGIGELSNFVLGCALVLPAGIIYKKNHNRRGAMIGMAAGTVLLVILGCLINAFVLLPAYGKAFGMPVEALVGMGTAVNPHITGLSTFVLLAVAPFNLLKGVLDSLIVLLIYKKISPILKMH